MSSRRCSYLALLLRAAACLCVGLVVSCAVVALAKYDEENKAWSSPQSGGSALICGEPCTAWVYDENLRSGWYWWPSNQASAESDYLLKAEPNPSTPSLRSPPSWAVPIAVVQYQTVRRAQAIAYGWPFRSVFESGIGGTRPNSPAVSYEASSEVRIGEWSFPLRPLPLGLTLNTLFYATLTAALWFSASRTRAALARRRFERRGLCPRCKYNLQGLSPDPATNVLRCPECGQTNTPRPIPQAAPP